MIFPRDGWTGGTHGRGVCAALGMALGMAFVAGGGGWGTTVGAMRIPEVSLSMPLLSASVRVGERAPLPVAGSGVPQRWSLPLAFEPADERAPGDAGYIARGDGYTVYVTGGGALLALSGGSGMASGTSDEAGQRAGRRERVTGGERALHLVRLRFEGAETEGEGIPEGPMAGRVHRLRGEDPSGWQTGGGRYGRVRYTEVYPGIDVVFHGHGRELEYDFVVGPGSDPGQARLRFDGVSGVTLGEDGGLRIETGVGMVHQRAPVAFQDGPLGRESVRVGYRIEEDGAIGFELGDYDRDRTLVIDPILSYATFLGGSGVDQCWDIAVDGDGSVWVAGETESASLSNLRILSTNTWSPVFLGGQAGIGGDAFVARLNADGTAVEWFTYLGGSDLDGAFTLAIGAGGEPVIGGFTSSTNFPVTAGAVMSAVPGLTNRFTGRLPLSGFVTRLTADGSGIVSSTLFGGDGEDQVIDLEVLEDGRVVAVGSTTSTNLPLPGTTLQAGAGGGTDAFLVVLDGAGTEVLGGGYLGGSGRDSAEGVAVWGGMAHVVGITASTNFPVRRAWQSEPGGQADGFVAGYRLAGGAEAWEYATYFGGGENDYAYRGRMGPTGELWVVGETGSTNFPTLGSLQSTNAGFIDGFVARFTEAGTLVSSTYFGGGAVDALWDVAVDGRGRAHVVGESASGTLPGVGEGSLQSTNRGAADLVLAWIDPDGTLLTTYYGAPGEEVAYGVAADAAGNTYVTGRVLSPLFPVSSTNVAQATFGGGRTDGFVLKVVHEPLIEAARVEGGVEVSWTAPNPGFVLETASALGGAEAWAPAGVEAEVRNGRHVVRLPIEAADCVFRLRWERQ
ncbi:MAG: hypothetical protein KF833_21980 [Verrucomicrobiae bacterium]|nr:hypothetical protein [Verrucomicrobiae bacterium]